jgi:hypothetical protein
VKSSQFTIHTTMQPGVPYVVDQAELDQLNELGYVASIDSTTSPEDKVIITAGGDPSTAGPLPVGQVWYNEAGL